MSGRPDDESLPAEDAVMIAESLKAQSPSPERAAALKARILAGVRAEAAASAQTPSVAPVPEPAAPAAVAIRGFLTIHAKDRVWERVAPGVEMCTLIEEADRRSILIRMQPGSFLLPHQHEMSEESLILEGDARIGADTYLTAGDYHYSPAGALHPVLESPQGCIAYIRCERTFRPRVTVGLLKRLVRGVLGKGSDAGAG